MYKKYQYITSATLEMVQLSFRDRINRYFDVRDYHFKDKVTIFKLHIYVNYKNKIIKNYKKYIDLFKICYKIFSSKEILFETLIS